ncbi:hypothetical protein AB6A40_008678 [Gnathostoma spinigerum]|uniref:Tubulin--tyrosine ligase-like protein 9 n=1 Tax=Gnathostoma spinigerum TaxID=75299 RepID=A0ABD6EUV9_9BILA
MEKKKTTMTHEKINGDGVHLILWKCSMTNTILDVLRRRDGWMMTNEEDWDFNWVTREWMNTVFDSYRFRERQVVCHFRGDYGLTRKDYLIKNYNRLKRTLEKSNSRDAAKMNFLPPSYEVPADYHLFVEEFRKYPEDTIWIMKPVSGAQGRGIFLFKRLKDITEWKKKQIAI